MLGLRQAVHSAQQAIRSVEDAESRKGAEVWLNEIIWREFYIQILYHFPRVSKTSFNQSLANIHWRNDAGEFDSWAQGQTGYPVVDASMRQLRETGWMHNRARMIVPVDWWMRKNLSI